MSAQIDSKPTLIVPSNQPLIFTISDTGSAPDRFVVWVDEDGTQIAKLYLTPNTNNKVHFNLAEVVRDRIKVDDKIRDESATLLSYDTKPFTTGRNGLRKYQVEVGRFHNNTESSPQDSDVVYLLDGAEQLSSGLHPSFADYYPTASTKKVWLTDREPVNNIVNVNVRQEDEGCIAFLNDSNIISGLAGLVEYKLYDASGSVLQTELDTINSANGAQLPADSDINQKLTYLMAYPANIKGWISAGKAPEDNPSWSYYDIQLETGSLAQTSNIIRFHKECGAVKHDNTQLAWTNTRGGWDSLTFTGRLSETETTQSKPYQKQIGDWDASTYTFLPQAREIESYQRTNSIKHKLNRIDFSFAEMELLRYALRSDNVMMRIGDSGAWQPVTLDTKSYKVNQTASRMFSISVDVTLAQVVKC
tara:strand:+ start:1387 stop:2640 length:1254 start_codon:yes stop_codon:yes gene_type:complete